MKTSQRGASSLMYIIAAVVLVLIGVIVFSRMNRTEAPTTDTMVQQETPANTMMKDDSKTEDESITPGSATESADEERMEAGVKTITVEAGPFYFKPAEIKVKKGDKVKIVLNNAKGMHNLIIDELNVKTKTINGGESDTVEFTANKVGTFEYYCGVGNHRAMGMKGNLIVQ